MTDTAHVDDEALRRRARVVFWIGLTLLAIDVIVVATLWLHRRHTESRTRETRTSEVAKGPRVSVVRVEATGGERDVTLPADVRAWVQATIYAKVSGYVREVRVERGQRVKTDDVLATLQSPEIEADIESARSDAEVKKRNAQRMSNLAAQGVVSRIDRDIALNDARMAAANLAKALDMRTYTVLRAPFDGVVTARYVDPGALLPAATGATQAATPLVEVADVDRVRVFLFVGQDVAPYVHDGDPVTLTGDERAIGDVAATVTRTAGALDPRTRTMEVEIDLDNREHRILPGTFVHGRLHLKAPPSPVVPNEALVFRDGKTVVAVVKDDRVHLEPVVLGPTDGRKVQVVRGLSGGETVGVDVPISVEEGSRVQPMQAPSR